MSPLFFPPLFFPAIVWLLSSSNAGHGEAKLLRGDNGQKRIDALIKILGHPQAQGDNLEETVRAIKALAAIGKPAVSKLVQAIVKKDGHWAAYSALALDEIGDQGVDEVRRLWNNVSELDKWKLMRFCGKFDYRASLDFALASLGSKEPEVRNHAIQYLGRYVESRASKRLVEMLNVEVPERHRWHIVNSLGQIADERSIEALIALLAPSTWAARGVGLTRPANPSRLWWPDGRKYVVEALGQAGNRKAAPALLAVLREKGPGKAHLGFLIMPILADWGNSNSIPELKLIATSEDDFSKRLAALSLFQLRDRSALPVLLKDLNSQYPTERRRACEVIAIYGDKRDVLTLGKALYDSDEHVQIFACQGLERITGVTNRASGQSIRTLADVPLWRSWIRE